MALTRISIADPCQIKFLATRAGSGHQQAGRSNRNAQDAVLEFAIRQEAHADDLAVVRDRRPLLARATTTTTSSAWTMSSRTPQTARRKRRTLYKTMTLSPTLNFAAMISLNIETL